MTILLDFLILLSSVLAALFCIWRSQTNFTRGYTRLGYAYMLMFRVAVLVFLCQSFLFGL